MKRNNHTGSVLGKDVDEKVKVNRVPNRIQTELPRPSRFGDRKPEKSNTVIMPTGTKQLHYKNKAKFFLNNSQVEDDSAQNIRTLTQTTIKLPSKERIANLSELHYAFNGSTTSTRKGSEISMYVQSLADKSSGDNPMSFLVSPSERNKIQTAEEIFIDLGFAEGDDYALEDKKEIMHDNSLKTNMKSDILNSTGYFQNSVSHLNSKINTARKSIEDKRIFFSPPRNIGNSPGYSPDRNQSFQIVGPKFDNSHIFSPKPKREEDDMILEEEEEDIVYDRTAKVSFIENNVPIHEFLDKNGELWKEKTISTKNSLLKAKQESVASNFESDKFTIDVIPTNPNIDYNRKVLSPAYSLLSNTDLKDDEKLDITMLRAIFTHDIGKVQQLLKLQEVKAKINEPDSLGNTILMLTVKLSHKHLQHLEVAKLLLANGADPKIKDLDGWSCLDEAISQGDVMLVATLLDNLIERKKKALKAQQEKLTAMLKKTPDFYLEMKWDFESSFIPFISKLAPSDTFKIWKYKNYLRMDNTLVSFKTFKSKRRDMSLIFNPDLIMPTGYECAAPLFTLYRNKSQYTNILQDFDKDEKQAMIYDLLKANPLQGTFNMKDCQFSENKGFLNMGSHCKIHGWDTNKYDFKVLMEYALFKKPKALFKDNLDSYLIKLELANRNPMERMNERNASQILNQMKNKNGVKKVDSKPPSQIGSQIEARLSVDTFENTKVTEKKANASVWLAKQFPLKFSAILPVLQFLGNGNYMLEKLDEILKKEEVSSVLLGDDAFPVKIQVPLTLSIKANVTIVRMEYTAFLLNSLIRTLKQNEQIKSLKELFYIPTNFKYINRKDAQKTLTRVKKRMLLINTLT